MTDVSFSVTERLTVQALRARPLDLPLETPIETASGTLATAPLVLVDLFVAEGLVGRSYASIYTPLALAPLTRLLDNLAELIVGKPADPEALSEALGAHFKLLGLQGLTGIAAATIDMAVWDAQAKAAGRPLSRLLGSDRDRIPAYASLASRSPERAAEEAAEARAQGFTSFKVKIGHSDLESDLAALRAVREVIGISAELMIDYNQVLSVDEAIKRAQALESESIFWIEEPTRADDYAGHAKIAAATTIPIQLGENWWGIHDMEKSIAAGASRHVMLDALKIGGVSGWLGAAALAEQAALPVSSHAFPEVSTHLLAATPTAHRLEYLDKVRPILAEPIEVRDGQIVLSDSPGIGIDWDETAISFAQG